jgi:hypothetical protein
MAESRLAHIGRQQAGTTVEIRDDGSTPVPAGELGEIFVQAWQVMEG